MPSAAPKLPEIHAGDVVLERYRVVEQIGSGGHSVVFKGQDERLSRPVCIKVFSGLGGESGVGRTSYEHFVQEAFALSRLTHPNTLRIYDFGHLGPKDAAGMPPLQVCEYMNGGTLSNIVREQGNQSLAETVRVTSAMCAALAEAHGLGIVHRDIKPQNILFGSVGPNRLPKLADFGIAKWTVDDNSDKENIAEDTAMVAGQKLAMYSPSWAAPEQLAGQPVSAATDIYSLACVAVYMLCGKAIFADEDVYAGYKKRRYAHEHVREALLPLALPPGVIEVMVRALAFDPKKRHAKVDQLSSELQRSLEPAPPEAKVVEPTTAPQDALPPGGPGEVSSGTTSPLSRAVVERAALEASPSTPAGTSGPATAAAPPARADMTPATYHARATLAWMAHAPVPTGMPHRLALSEVAQPVGDRRVHFVLMIEHADLVGPHGTKLRITLLPGPAGGLVVHLKGLSCFVAPVGGRPSPAVQLDRSGDIALVTPRAQEIGHLRVVQGANRPGQLVFPIGSDLVAVATEDCADPILFDFGPGADAYFVYTRGRTVPKSGRRG
jgi:serine/threonine-protein kinase